MSVVYCSEEFCLGEEPQTNKSCYFLLRNCMKRATKKVPKTEAKRFQQIVESFSHRALFLWTACVCSTEIENENRFCLVNVHQIWNQLLCNQVSQMFLLLMTPSSSLQLIFCVWEPNGSRFRISLILKDFFM